MLHHHHRRPFGKIFIFAGLLAALILGILGTCFLKIRTTTTTKHPPRVSLAELDAKAQPFFDEANRNVPDVIRKLTGTKSLCKLCWYMARDKLSGSKRTRTYLASVLQKPITEPCQKAAKIYGCTLDSESFLTSLQEVNADYAVTGIYAAGGLVTEAIFLRSTVASLRAVLGSIVTRLAASCGTGAALAAADGPFPFGDAIGAVMALGGTAWCCYDLYSVCKQLPQVLTSMLQQSIQDCRNACRLEAVK